MKLIKIKTQGLIPLKLFLTHNFSEKIRSGGQKLCPCGQDGALVSVCELASAY